MFRSSQVKGGYTIFPDHMLESHRNTTGTHAVTLADRGADNELKPLTCELLVRTTMFTGSVGWRSPRCQGVWRLHIHSALWLTLSRNGVAQLAGLVDYPLSLYNKHHLVLETFFLRQ
jgi:hypothetical protein